MVSQSLLLTAGLLPFLCRESRENGCLRQRIRDIWQASRQEVCDMRILRHIGKWLYELLCSDMGLSTGIDSHKWESKIEILGRISSRC